MKAKKLGQFLVRNVTAEEVKKLEALVNQLNN